MAASKKRVYIFQSEYDVFEKLVLSNTKPEALSGNLFGLWTTDGEPVIHIVSREHSCEVGKDLSLSHIGDWYYGYYLKRLSTRRSQRDVKNCSHNTEGKFLETTVSLKRSGQEVTLRLFIVNLKRGSPKALDVEVLKTESPFREIDTGSRLNEGFEVEEEMEWSTSEVYPSSSYLQKDPYGEITDAGEAFPRNLDKRGIQQRSTFFSSGYQRSSSRDFKVFMFEEDIERIEKYILAYPHLETGGDLFGLWTTNGDAVIHIALGPGQNCKRTGASFYQDIPYLQRNGNLLTQDYLLCHIGEWHSHHQLRLFQPSQGDSTTVIRNYPRGTQGFLLIIGNIESNGSVRLSPYLYTERSTYSFDKAGTVQGLRNENPFNKIEKIKYQKEKGSEVREHSRYPRAASIHSPLQSSYSPLLKRSSGSNFLKVTPQAPNGGVRSPSSAQLPWR